MKCKDLFKGSDVVYVKADKNLKRQETDIISYANYHSISVSITLGIWVNSSSMQVERVLRIEKTGESSKPIYPSRKKSREITKKPTLADKIQELSEQGMKQKDIAKECKTSKQYVSYVINKGRK